MSILLTDKLAFNSDHERTTGIWKSMFWLWTSTKCGGVKHVNKTLVIPSR
jgi:hypothetical protein